MHWGGYEVFSVLSGIVLVIVAVVGGLSGTNRMWAFLGGLGFIGYGSYVAGQDTGYFVFPVWIFIIPFAAVIYLIVSMVGRNRSEKGD